MKPSATENLLIHCYLVAIGERHMSTGLAKVPLIARKGTFNGLMNEAVGKDRKRSTIEEN